MIEGEHLIKEAHQARCLQAVLITDEQMAMAGIDNYLVNPLIINKLSQTKSPTNIIGVCAFFRKQNSKEQGFCYWTMYKIPVMPEHWFGVPSGLWLIW